MTSIPPERQFPVLLSHRPRHETLGCPRSVPWSLLTPHEERAKMNHDQSLERLAERGGLDPAEMLAILEDRRWKSMEFSEIMQRLTLLLKAHRATV